MSENTAKFISAFTDSLADGTFIKATLGNYKGSDEHLQKINIRTIETKKGRRLFMLYKYATRDTAKNFSFADGMSVIKDHLANEFRSGHLFTVSNDYQLDIGKKNSRLNVSRPTIRTKPATDHDRKKERLIDPSSFYLHALGITTDDGKVRDKQQRKWTQINRFVEILASLVERSRLKDATKLRIVDMGSGKGYLTFAAYDHFAKMPGVEVTITGVETRDNLVSLCNDIAKASGFDGLEFVTGTIDSYEIENVDILIALHACDTATDDALYKGINSNAELIVAAPCCHQELRPQMTPPPMFRDVLKHGVLLERTAETITDGIRSLLLEREGYATKMIEFVSVEHSPKNNMLVAAKLDKPNRTDEIQAQIVEIKASFGITNQRLADSIDSGATESLATSN